MNRPVYVIKDWDLLYETYESKRLVRGVSWVAMPNKHDGKGFRRLIREKDGAAMYGAWSLLVQVASKCPVRGVLADLDGALDAVDLEDKTGIAAQCFERTLKVVVSERIGWMRAITDAGEIEALLAGVTARRTHAARRLPQTPADSASSPHAPADHSNSPQTPAGSALAPAACGQNGNSAGTPADARRLPQINAPRGRALADSTGPDKTRPDTPAGAAAEVLSETAHRILRIFGKKRSRLSQDAEQQLAAWAQDLPLSEAQWHSIEAFMALPDDPKDFDLKARPGHADSLAKNLFAVLERAERYAGMRPEKNDPQKKVAPVPEGWRHAYTKLFPRAVPADSIEWRDLDERVQVELRRDLEGGAQ